MSSTPMPARRVAIGRFRLPAAIGSTPDWWRIATLLAAGLALTAARPAVAGPSLTIGNVNTFKTSSSGTNPTGTWTLGDKDYTYLTSSLITGTSGTTGWRGFENIEIKENTNPAFFNHEFLIDNLSDYNTTGTSLFLGYRIHINGSQGPATFRDVALSQINSGNTVEVWKDVYGSAADYANNTGAGTGTLAKFYFNSVTAIVPPTVAMPAGLTDLWIRDTFLLSGGSLSSLNNTIGQKLGVPEIDPQSFASVLAIVTGALGLFERRARRWLGLALPV